MVRRSPAPRTRCRGRGRRPDGGGERPVGLVVGVGDRGPVDLGGRLDAPALGRAATGRARRAPRRGPPRPARACRREVACAQRCLRSRWSAAVSARAGDASCAPAARWPCGRTATTVGDDGAVTYGGVTSDELGAPGRRSTRRTDAEPVAAPARGSMSLTAPPTVRDETPTLRGISVAPPRVLKWQRFAMVFITTLPLVGLAAAIWYGWGRGRQRRRHRAAGRLLRRDRARDHGGLPPDADPPELQGADRRPRHLRGARLARGPGCGDRLGRHPPPPPRLHRRPR